VTRWCRLLAPSAALVATLALVAPSVAQTPIGPDEYLDRLARADELAQLDGEAPSPERMDELRTSLGLPIEVEVGGWLVEVHDDPILDSLSGETDADFELAALRLAALAESLTDAVAAKPVSSDEVATALSQAYAGVVPPAPNLLETVLRVIREVIEAIVQRIGNVLASAGNALAWIVLIAIGIIAILTLFRARLVPDRVAPAGRGSRAGAASVDWAARAEEALRAGDLHEAVRALYLSLLATLARRGIVADAPALTAGEARFAVQRARPAMFPAIERATESYERVVYGGATPDPDDIERLRDATAQARRP
jgi:Domain of unknown function (DUF4129)